MQATPTTPIAAPAIPNKRKPRVSLGRWGLGSVDPAASGDRRRRARRELSQAISARIEPLHPADAALLRAIFEQDMTIAQVCAAAHGPGLKSNLAPSQSHDLERIKRRLRYRVRQLVARVLSPGYEFILQHEHQIPPDLQRIARICVLQGRNQRDASIELNLSLFETRRRLIAVRALIDAARRARSDRTHSDRAGKPVQSVSPPIQPDAVPSTH